MRKRWNYVIGILALGVVVFNNSIQLAEVMRSNPDYMTGLIIALIGSVLYGIVNIR